MPRTPLPRSALVWLSLAAIALATTALAAPLAHEFVPPDPREDLQLGATTTVGDLPAAIETPGGMVSAPDPYRAPGASEKAYSRSAENQTFVPDRDTRPVNQVDYDDPFSPTVAPFKRLNSFDAVGNDSSFRVADAELRRVGVGGNVQLNEDPFYGDLTVDLVAGEAVRIPSVGPAMRILRLHTIPQAAVEVLRDGADNYYLRGPARQRVRVLLQVAVARGSLGGPLRDALWGDLPASTALPASLQAPAEEANRAIGVGRHLAFREVIERLVAYYRSFTTTDTPLPAKGNIFLDIALSKKGVCRHRAYAFVISALAMRIPARMVTNEAHAWVEVHDGQLWHRIDLGGAALNFHDTSSGDQIPHTPPPDPFSWPPGADPGAESARRAAPAGSVSGTASSTAPGGSAPLGSGSARPPGSAFALPPQPDDDRPPTLLTVASADHEVTRNQALHLEGQALVPGGGVCPHLLVNVSLMVDGSELPLGALATDEEGRYQGAVVIPPSVSLGDHELIVSTPGDLRCGHGQVAPSP